MADQAALAHNPLLARVLDWLYQDELRHSRLIWRLEADARLDPPWPYRDVWHDPAGAVLVDFAGHPKLGSANPPWYQAEADDQQALELLCAVRLPPVCEVLLHTPFVPVLETLGVTEHGGVLEVYHCPPGELGEAALPYEPTRLTLRHRALVAAADWRPDDLANEVDEHLDGVRWAILRDGRIICRLLAHQVAHHTVEIADLHTHPQHRRRGYGAALVQNVVRRLHERGLTATYSVHPDNLPSKRLAEQVGFRPAFTWQRVRLARL